MKNKLLQNEEKHPIKAWKLKQTAWNN